MFQQVITHPNTYRLQVIYTQINRDKSNTPHFTNYYFNVDTNLYFYPASTVKLPLAALSLEKLNELHKKGINKYTSMQFDSAYSRQVIEYNDSTSQSGLPSIAQFIRKAFLISDNDAYNRMYQFVGQQAINRKLHQKGYVHTRIVRQFMGFTDDENRHTNPVRFIDEKGNILYEQPMRYNIDSMYYPETIPIGKAYYNRNDSLVNEPMNFARQNTIPLEDLQQLLQSILFPASVPAKQRFKLTKKDYQFLWQYLSQYPSETPYPKYDTAVYYDSYVKFFFNNETHQMPNNVRVFNKVGWSYGFLTDASYIVDFAHNTEFMLAATIYVNKDDTLNDDQYEYETVGHPFLYQLGQTIYNYELHRPRPYPPNLSEFKMQYEHRDANDRRPSIKDADN
ncbi:serine hydrolase [Ilyomonas limi]|uniref:serine hydrolase n=1 Tax=Ilyomonas limi TaxID=2575867 RepID=UPI001F0D4051|nr:serine hydrolase [Ilyomonas limi]